MTHAAQKKKELKVAASLLNSAGLLLPCSFMQRVLLGWPPVDSRMICSHTSLRNFLREVFSVTNDDDSPVRDVDDCVGTVEGVGLRTPSALSIATFKETLLAQGTRRFSLSDGEQKPQSDRASKPMKARRITPRHPLSEQVTLLAPKELSSLSRHTLFGFFCARATRSRTGGSPIYFGDYWVGQGWFCLERELFFPSV